MKIRMTGIDYSTAPVEIREKFSFSKSKTKELLRQIKTKHHPDGCVLIRTCNRTELWLSGECPKEPYTILCEATGQNKDQYKENFINKEGTQALWHLFKLSCGLKSMVYAEDQIITQVKEALLLARET